MLRYLLAAGVLGGLLLATHPALADDAPAKQGKKKNPEVLFKKIDTNNDGKLSKEEVTNFFAAKSQKTGKPKDGSKLFARLDTNKDGFLSLSEFQKIAELKAKKPKVQ